MEEQEYRSIYALEDTHWWYVSLRELVSRSVGAHLRECGPGLGWGDPVRALDAGCGTGAMLATLGRGCRAVGLDNSGIALALTRERGQRALVRGSVSTLPFADKTFDIVVSLDVLYHSAVEDDVEALREIKRVLKPGGVAVFNLPAYEFLRGRHDLAVHTKRRYTRRLLKKRLSAAGLAIERITYRNALLFPAIAVFRLIKRRLGKAGDTPSSSDSDLSRTHPLINHMLLGIMRAEGRILKRFDLPFGTSVYCVARRY